MSIKDFKRGMEAGAKPFNDKFNQVSEAVNKVGDQINKKMDSFNGVMDVIIDDLNSIKKKEIYDLNTKLDIKADLDDAEKELLAALLITISNGDSENNLYQQRFIRSVNSYMGIQNPQLSINMSSIENIENLSAQKAILQVIMEYLFLEYGNFEFWEDYEENLFECFNVNRKGVNEIKECIKIIYNATGFEGIAEKYGYVVEENFEDETKSEEKYYKTYDGSDICEKCADEVNVNKYVVLDDYLVYEDDNFLFKVKKIDGTKEKINIELEAVDKVFGLGEVDKIFGQGKYIVVKIVGYINYMIIIDIETLKTENIEIEDRLSQCMFLNKGKLFYTKDVDGVRRICVYNCEDKKTQILEYIEDNKNILSFDKYYVYEDCIYINSGYGSKGLEEKTLYKYTISTGELEKMCEIPANMVFDFLDGDNTYRYNNYLYTKVANKYCLYINLDEPKGIRSESLPVDSYQKIDAFVGYGVLYYVMLNYDFSIHRYNLFTGESSVILEESGCGLVGERREGLLKKVTFFKVAREIPQVVGEWLYYRGNTSGNILKVSRNAKNGTSQVVNL